MSNRYGSFQSYMRQVNFALHEMCGLGHLDLADQNYYDMYMDEVPPQEAAEVALEDNGFDLAWLD